MTRIKPYFEILEFGKAKKRFDLSLSDISFDVELMDVPTISLTNVQELLPYLQGRKEIKIYTENAVFYGNTQSLDIDTVNGTIEINLKHIVSEWEYRQVPTNYAFKNKKIPEIYKDEQMIYSKEWKMNYDESVDKEIIDYVYSRQSKLEALTKTCELTKNLFWRIPFTKEKQIDIGSFGEKKQYTVSLRPSGRNNIRIIEEPKVKIDFSNVINLATVYADKSDGGMTSLTLREVYNDETLQSPKFPVVIMRNNINNERDYDYIDFPKLAPNNQLEYSIIDTESVAMESGLFIEGTFSFDDLNPFSLEEKSNEQEQQPTGNWLPQEFIDVYNGRSVDMDGQPPEQPYQCVDVWKKALEIIGYPNPSRPLGGDGYAWEIWKRRHELGYDEFFDYPSTPQFGDFAIFDKMGDTPDSHVSMFVSDNGNDTGQFFGQNQPYPYCGMNTTSTKNILGWLRVKKKYWKGQYDPEQGNGVQNITDEDRIKCAKTVYDATVRKLINSRRKFQIEVLTEQLPRDLNVGDKVRLVYNLNSYIENECSKYLKKIVQQDDWYFVTKLGRKISKDGLETGSLVLEKYLRIDREGKQES